MQYEGIEYLKSKLARVQPRIKKRYSYYEQKYTVHSNASYRLARRLGIKPTHLGWCTKAVDELANRLVFKGFKNDTLGMNDIYRMNNMNVLVRSLIHESLICSCAFIHVKLDENGYPMLEEISGKYATGILDKNTGYLKEGYAILDVDEKDNVISEAYFTAEETVYITKGEDDIVIPNPTGFPLLVPIMYRPDGEREFGHSRISRTCMDLVDDETVNNLEMKMCSYFHAFPQKYALGIDTDEVDFDRFQASVSTMLTFSRDEDGNVPSVGSFQQASMTPFMDASVSNVKMFCGETGLTSDDLGFVTVNPSSADAIESSHESLRATAMNTQAVYTDQLARAGLLAVCLRDGQAYAYSSISGYEGQWKQTFKSSSTALSSIGDGVLKIQQANPNFITDDILAELTGIEGGAPVE